MYLTPDETGLLRNFNDLVVYPQRVLFDGVTKTRLPTMLDDANRPMQ